MDISNTPGYVGLGYFDTENQLLGFLMGNIEIWDQGKIFYINEICIDASNQNKKIGSALLKDLKTILKKKNIKKIYLSTEKGHNKPQAFFSKNGYSTVEQRVTMIQEIN